MKIELTNEYLKDRFHEQKWSYFQISQESGWSVATVNKTIGILGLRKKKQDRGLDLKGQRFGKLIVEQKSDDNSHNSIRWDCKCDCGGFSKPTTKNLRSGIATSCGCNRLGKGEKSKCWKGMGKVSGRQWSIIQSGAKQREIPISVTLEYISNLFNEQGEKCAMTGWPLLFASDSAQTASLDRIDSDLGYIEGNVQWVHKDINLAKNTMSQDKFITLCKRVAEFNN